MKSAVQTTGSRALKKVKYPHSVEKAGEFSSAALKRLQDDALALTPSNYELWYVYYSEENPEITRSIDVLEAAGDLITQDVCDELYEKYLADDSQSEKVKEAGDKVQNTIREVNSMVTNAKEATSKYNSSLGNVTEKLHNKDISRDEIEAVLKNVMDNTKQMMAQNEALEEKLGQSSQAMIQMQRDLEIVRKEALTDSLTGLANRKAFDAEIRRIVHEAKQEGIACCLLMLDIDHFKSFNDNYGHQVGDQVLRLVARTLTDGVKGRDIASRFGGEEFAILLPETNLQGSVKVGDSLRLAVANKEIINRNTGDKLGRITLSGGVAEYVAGESVEDLIERADAALYTAKHNGRNQIAAAPAPGQRKAKV